MTKCVVCGGWMVAGYGPTCHNCTTDEMAVELAWEYMPFLASQGFSKEAVGPVFRATLRSLMEARLEDAEDAELSRN